MNRVSRAATGTRLRDRDVVVAIVTITVTRRAAFAMYQLENVFAKTTLRAKTVNAVSLNFMVTLDTGVDAIISVSREEC